MTAESVRLLTDMDVKQLNVQGRRMKLSSDVQRECRALDAQIRSAERDEERAAGERSDVIKGKPLQPKTALARSPLLSLTLLYS